MDPSVDGLLPTRGKTFRERGGLLYSTNQQTFLVHLLWVDPELGFGDAAEGLEERY